MNRPDEYSPFHRGELAMQQRAGVAAQARRVGGIIGDSIPENFARFLATVRMAAVGAEDEAGRLWATILVGPRGFLAARGPEDARDRLEVAARPAPGDRLAAVLAGESGAGRAAGLVAIDPPTRRRVRVNGVLATFGDGFAIDVREAYGNCPKYITARTVPEPTAAARGAAAHVVNTRDALTPGQAAILGAADMLFLATMGPDGRADASHRGGAPGFLAVADASHLVIPDYAGNQMFNSLGNLLVDPRIALVVPALERGALIQISGRATISDDPGARAPYPGAERVLEVAVEVVAEIPGALPAGWTLLGYSPFDPPAHGG